ncbi:hypothetical protein QOZ80_3BG0254920 [Eleusine coracana subsp. coracana]|nr:hypothetical protein QOZ80_3BG0254920 [Eleusine coracana subsp. coracana]
MELPPKSSRPERPSNNEEKKKQDVKVSKISLRGCTQLKNLFLRGLSNLTELDLSGSPLKILDFESLVVDVPRLKRLYLVGCEHLRAIKWRSTEELEFKLELLCIDTRPAGTWTSTQPPPAPVSQHESFSSSRNLLLHAVLADVRLVRSLSAIIRWGNVSFDIQHGPYSSAVNNNGEIEGVVHQPAGVQVQRRHHNYYCVADDVLTKMKDTHPTPPPMEALFPEPPAGRSDRHVEISGGGPNLESELVSHIEGYYCLADMMRCHAESLHVHDASISVSMTGKCWEKLRWFRVERCPNLESTLFHLDAGGFEKLEVVWVSELAKTRCLWSKGPVTSVSVGYNLLFQSLRHLCLRSCPRLQYALPLRAYKNALRNLETLHVIHCGELRHVFELGEKCDHHQEEEEEEEDDIDAASNKGSSTMKFPSLTTIHLHDLPMLRGICDVKMIASNLETVRIRGCFNLRRLPTAAIRLAAIDYRRLCHGRLFWRRCGPPTVEVEKDVWDVLEWDGENVGHHPRFYAPPVHSRHYRNKRILRGTVLR